MATDYFTIKIGSVWLSVDGSDPAGSLACRTSVEGLSQLATALTGPVVKAITGKPWQFLQENAGEGVEIVLKPFVMTPSVLTSLIGVIDTANSTDATINVTLTDGELPDYDLNCIVKIAYAGNFSDNQIQDLIITAIVDSIN